MMVNFGKDFGPSILRKRHSLEALEKALASNRESKTVALCHGTFDLVHPGHLRHFAYAKAKADFLVVSLTGDSHVEKGNLRPYVPEDMRALNLAAIELVDFVVVDHAEEPLELLRRIKPDYYVKGFDYVDQGNPKTHREKELVESYGGEILFSPGDFTMSSSQILKSSPPSLSLEKLLVLMELENFTFADLRGLVSHLKGIRATVIGDTIVDGWTEASVTGGFRKTPTPSITENSNRDYVGGAAVVAKHLASLGADVQLVSFVGADSRGDFVARDLMANGVTSAIEVLAGRPTTYKRSIAVSGQKIFQINQVDNAPIDNEVVQRLAGSIWGNSELVVFSDFRHGLFHQESIPVLRGACPSDAFIAADSQVASRWGNVLDFADCDLLTPTEEEARFALGDQDSTVRPLGSRLRREAGARNLILKLGDRGLMAFRDSERDGAPREFFSLDSLARPAFISDPVGAGDALLAWSSAGVMRSSNIVQGVILGAVAAALECEFVGNQPISSERVLQKLVDLESAAGLQ